MKNIIIIIIVILFIKSDSISQDTLYLYKSGVVFAKHAIASIDSAIFYKTTTSQQVNTVSDKDNNIYKTVTIGTQTWMAENLRVTKYNDGTAIPLVTNYNAWGNYTPGRCYYNNDSLTYKNTYGALYNKYSVNTNKLCPTGWHIPTNAEWATLITFLGDAPVAALKLKEVGTTHWNAPNLDVTNETDFTALPGGYRAQDGTFSNIGNSGYWWSSTEYDTQNGWITQMSYNSTAIVNYGGISNRRGISVRCIKDL